jgi:hypothetical protein
LESSLNITLQFSDESVVKHLKSIVLTFSREIHPFIQQIVIYLIEKYTDDAHLFSVLRLFQKLIRNRLQNEDHIKSIFGESCNALKILTVFFHSFSERFHKISIINPSK